MKTIKKLACLCAVALAGVSYLTSCSSDEVEVNPNYDAERGVVKTEFTISLPAKAAGGTRMTTAIVQGQNPVVFRGITGIQLFPFSDKKATILANPSTTSIPGAITLAAGSSVAKLGPSSTNPNEIAGSGALFEHNNAHLYQDIEVATGTKAFMFYGVASASTGGDKFTDGALVPSGIVANNKLSQIAFTPEPIYQTSTGLGNNYDDIELYLTNIANTTSTAAAPNDKWSTTNNVILQTLYQKFISMKAGSWASVKGAVKQLYSSLHERCYTYNSGTSSYDETSFAATGPGTLAKAIMTAIITDTNVSDDDKDGKLSITEGSYGNFPADISLPDGAIYMNFQDKANPSDGKEFKMMTDPVTNNQGLNIAALGTYVYPASLYYRALSDIRTSTQSMFKYYDDTDGNTDHKTTWADIITQYGTEVTSGDNQNDEVKYTTRSIAIVDEVQYAVGRLDVTVSASSANLSDGATPASSIPLTHPDPNDNTSTVYNFPVTGILISNQRAVDYKFEPTTAATPTLYTIYDKTIEVDGSRAGDKCLRHVAVASLTDADKIHTLVLETPEVPASPSEDQLTNGKVKIVVEFKNNSGQLFVGRNSEIIYPDGKFYLVGEFDPTDTSPNTSNTAGLRQVFKQDYTTTANLVVGSLQNAYNTLPDLRAPRLELGLSVNLTWNQGITQTINIQ